VVRRRLNLPARVVLPTAALAPIAASVVLPRGRTRSVAVCSLQMWAYLAAYEMPNDDPEALVARVRVRYPIVADRILGLGRTPSARLQRAFSTPGEINRFERILAWCHWLWFFVPHGSAVYILVRHPERFPSAAARTYTLFDMGALFYWVVPTAPPWWAAARGHMGPDDPPPVRRMMIEYGARFWGERWDDLYDVLGGNPLAAMPSMHFATSLMAAHLLSETGPVAGALGWAYAGTLGLALVYLGEHYAIDLIAGAALAEAVRAGSGPATPAARGIARALNALQARAAGA
jgi:hypothetical protein